MALSPTSSRGGSGTVTGVTAADTSIVVAGTAAAPTLATGTLDVIATNHPPAADVAFNAKKITGLGTPTLSTDAVTKAYTDAAINGLDWKQAARLASAAALPANTYVNGASGVGATLTGNAFGALSIDGVAVAVNDRVLLKHEGTGSRNGIYSVTATGGGAAFYVLTRTADYNTTAEIVAGTGLYITEGAANTDTSWVMTTTGAVTVGTTALTFTQFGGGGSSAYVGACIRLGTSDVNHTSGDVPFDTTDFDSGGVADLVNHRLVVPAGKGGVWAFGCSLKGLLSGTPAGATTELSTSGNAPNGYVPAALTGNDLIYCSGVIHENYAAGDTVELPFTVVGSGAITLLGGANGCVLYGWRLGATP